MKINKALAISLATVMVFALDACSGDSNASSSSEPPPQQSESSSSAESSAPQESRVYFQNLSPEDEALYQTLTKERGLQEWQVNSLSNKGFLLQDMINLSDKEINQILAPGSNFTGDRMTPDEMNSLVESGMSDDNVNILMALGYDYNSALALTPEQIDFIFPNTELVDNLVALGYDRNVVQAAGFLPYETYKELLDEVFEKHFTGGSQSEAP